MIDILEFIAILEVADDDIQVEESIFKAFVSIPGVFASRDGEIITPSGIKSVTLPFPKNVYLIKVPVDQGVDSSSIGTKIRKDLSSLGFQLSSLMVFQIYPHNIYQFQ